MNNNTTKHENLINTRKALNFTQKQMASKIAMDQTTYSKKELGKTPIRDDEWQKIANVLEVPIEIIKAENPTLLKNEGCTFTKNAIGIQYVNIPQNAFDIIIKYSTKLEEKNIEQKQAINNLKQTIQNQNEIIIELKTQINSKE